MSKEHKQLAERIVANLSEHQLVKAEKLEESVMPDEDYKDQHHVAVVTPGFVFAANADTKEAAQKDLVEQITKALDTEALVLSDTWEEDNLPTSEKSHSGKA